MCTNVFLLLLIIVHCYGKMQSVKEAKVRYEQNQQEEAHKRRQEKKQRQLNKKIKEAQEEADRVQHEKGMKLEADARRKILEEVDPANTFFNYARNKIENDETIQQLMLSDISEKNKKKFELFHQGPILCGGYFYYRGFNHAEFTYRGEKIEVKDSEIERACYENRAKLYYIINKGPIQRLAPKDRIRISFFLHTCYIRGT